MVTIKSIQQVEENMTEEEKARLAKKMKQDLDRAIAEINELAERGNGYPSWSVYWDGTTWVIVDASGKRHPRAARKALPDVPNAMHNGQLTVLVNHAIIAALDAYHSAQSKQDADWHRGERVPTFMYQKEQGTVFIELRPPGKGPDDDRRLTETELIAVWAQLTGRLDGEKVPRITSLAGDVLMILLGQAMDSPPDETGLRWITAEQILDYRGLEKITKATEDGVRRSAGHRTERIEELGEVMRQLNNTWVLLNVKIIDETDARGRKRSKLYKWHSRLIAIADTITQEEVTPESTSNVAIAWSFALGSWAAPFLQAPNRFTAELVQQCLKYDPYHEPWEKRLADHFTMVLRMNASHSSTIPRQIGPLIKELSLPVNQNHPIWTKQSFERAMDKIRDDAVISSWRYRDGEPKPKRTGWLSDWLNLFIEVTATSGIKQQYRKIAERSETRRHRAETLEAAKQAKAKKRTEKK